MQNARAKIVQPGGGQHLNVIGDNQFIKVSGEETGGAYVVIEQVNAPGSGIPLHKHANEEETFHVMEGTVEFEADGETTVAGPGTNVHLPRGVPHAFKVVGDKPARVLLVLCPAGGERMFAELSKLPMPPDMAQVGEICGRYGVAFL